MFEPNKYKYQRYEFSLQSNHLIYNSID